MTRRVLVVSHEASLTGAPRVAGHLLTALRDGGWDTTLVHRWGGPLRSELDALADRAMLEPAAHVRILLRRRRSTKWLAARVERRAVRRTIRRVRPDLVWCNTVLTSPYAVEAMASGIAVVLHSHEQPRLVGSALDRAGFGRSVAEFDGVTLVGCATDTAEALADRTGCGPDRVAVLHSPVDVAALQAAAADSRDPYEGRPGGVVVACGTGDARKGVDTFNEAAGASVADAAVGARWVWVGRVPAELRGAATEFPGEQPSAVPWIAAADVVALPSRADVFPLVVLEAMALGVAVVASDIGGAREQLGDTGVFVPVADATALRAAVSALLSDEPRRSELGRRARERCEELWDLGPFGDRARAIADAAVGSPTGLVVID